MPKQIKTIRLFPRENKSRPRQADKNFYSQARWIKLSKMYLAENPLCECGCGELASEVHHRVDRKQRPDLAFDWDNLQALRKQCHSRITRGRQTKGEQ